MSKIARAYRKPNGKTTGSAREYIKAWRRLGAHIGYLTDSKCVGFEPGLLMVRNESGTTWDCPTDIALKLWKATSLNHTEFS